MKGLKQLEYFWRLLVGTNMKDQAIPGEDALFSPTILFA